MLCQEAVARRDALIEKLAALPPVFVDAVWRVIAAGVSVAMHAMVVAAANDGAKRFYEGFGFMPLVDRPMRLFLALGHAALRGPAE